jgi:hypothetical protein
MSNIVFGNKMSAIIVHKDTLSELGEEVNKFAELYESSRLDALILFIEAFGTQHYRVERDLEILGSFLKKVTIYENPLYGYYLPYLYLFGKSLGEDDLSRIVYETAEELVSRFEGGDYEKWERVVHNKFLFKEEARRLLVSIALSARFLTHFKGDKVWSKLSTLCSREFFETIMQQMHQQSKVQDLDPLTMAAALVLQEHINEIRRKKRLPEYNLQQWNLPALLEEKVKESSEITKASMASLLFDLYVSPYASSSVKILFLQLVDSISLEKLKVEFMERIPRSKDESEFYEDLYGSEEMILIPSIDEVEYMLLARFLRLLREAHIFIPISSLSEFVKNYYHIPKILLKTSLKLRSLALYSYEAIIRFCNYMLKNFWRVFISLLSSYLVPSYLTQTVLPDNPLTVIAGIVTFIVTYILTLFSEWVPKRFERYIKVNEEKINRISEERKIVHMKLRCFEWYIPFKSSFYRNHGLS